MEPLEADPSIFAVCAQEARVLDGPLVEAAHEWPKQHRWQTTLAPRTGMADFVTSPTSCGSLSVLPSSVLEECPVAVVHVDPLIRSGVLLLSAYSFLREAAECAKHVCHASCPVTVDRPFTCAADGKLAELGGRVFPQAFGRGKLLSRAASLASVFAALV